MAQRRPIEYVQFYTMGSAAQKLEVTKPKLEEPVILPRVVQKRKKVLVDPVAIFGMLIAMVLLVCMVSGVVQYTVLQTQNQQMTDYVTALELEKAQLEQTYRDGYNLDDIRDFAEANGMLPAEDLPQIQIEVELPKQEQPQLTWWDSFTTFLAGLFA